MKLATRRSIWRLAGLAAILILAGAVSYRLMIRMPGTSFRGPLPPLTEAQETLADRLRRDLDILAGEIGERNVFNPDRLHAAAAFIEESLIEAGYTVERQTYTVRDVESSNLEVEIPGTTAPDEIIIIGAHYDSIYGSPGANDNGSGVVATLALARAFAGRETERTLRFVFFVNEEPPFFQIEGEMGSLVYARRSRERGENIVAMLAVETIGYFSDAPGSQQYPPLVGSFYPSEGNFIGFVSNMKSRRVLREIVAAFRASAEFPSQGAALPSWIIGVGWSDHWSFWQAGYPGVMMTDTALFRYPYYHTPEDTPDKVDPERIARIVEGLEGVIERLVSH